MNIAKQHMQSKTFAGLLFILALSVGLGIAGKLTPEMVDVIKWVGSSYMAVRLGANVSENMGRRRYENREGD